MYCYKSNHVSYYPNLGSRVQLNTAIARAFAPSLHSFFDLVSSASYSLEVYMATLQMVDTRRQSR